MRGILSFGGYVPYRRLDRQTIAPIAGGGGGRGTRSVASYDEDTTTMAVEAARVALRDWPYGPPAALWFATTAPAYADRTNASAIHAALRLDRDVVANHSAAGGPRRPARLALRAASTAIVVVSSS